MLLVTIPSINVYIRSMNTFLFTAGTMTVDPNIPTFTVAGTEEPRLSGKTLYVVTAISVIVGLSCITILVCIFVQALCFIRKKKAQRRNEMSSNSELIHSLRTHSLSHLHV